MTYCRTSIEGEGSGGMRFYQELTLGDVLKIKYRPSYNMRPWGMCPINSGRLISLPTYRIIPLPSRRAHNTLHLVISWHIVTEEPRQWQWQWQQEQPM